MKERLTASMQTCFLSCMRRYYYRYELCLQHTSESVALRFGSAWHKAMECRWNRKTGEEALAAALAERQNIDELQVAMLTGMLIGYYRAYENDPIEEMIAEQEFELSIAHSRSFVSAGKIDGIGRLKDGHFALIEHKTTADSLDDNSDYWLTLRFNTQILQYVSAARACGIPIEVIFYDVAHKPAIRPKDVPMLDENGAKVVVDANSQRVFNKNGEPRQSAGEGMTLMTRLETMDEYTDRLTADVCARPTFYFARREVPVLDNDLEEFEMQRLAIARQLLYLRGKKSYQAWPRNCSPRNCSSCEYKGFCLQNIMVDTANPPAGFIIGEKNPELAVN